MAIVSGMKMSRLSRLLFFSIISLFLLFAGAFTLYQNRREKTFKIALLNQQLQTYNLSLGEALLQMPIDEDSLQNYLLAHPLTSVRITILDPHGFVLFDNRTKEYPTLSDHRKRKEIQEALVKGSGYCIDRRSITVEEKFFYSATYIPSQNLIIRSALPYDEKLPKSLRADFSFLWYAHLLMFVLVAVLFVFAQKVGLMVSKIQDQESLELQKELTQNISHELKTPISGIQAYLETLRSHPELPDKTRNQFIDRSWALARRLASLAEDLNSLDAAEWRVCREELDLADIIRNILQESEPDFQRRRISIKTAIPESIPMIGDRKILYSLFRNLTDNALHYAGEGSTVEILAREEGRTWHFSFADNGPGVPESCLPRLYERFFRIDKGRSREMGGTGLGLSIVKEAVRLHGGDIYAEAVSPHGLRHRFTLL